MIPVDKRTQSLNQAWQDTVASRITTSQISANNDFSADRFCSDQQINVYCNDVIAISMAVCSHELALTFSAVKYKIRSYSRVTLK